MPLASRVGLHGRARVSVREADSGLLVVEDVFDNLETQYALNSVAAWLAGGAGVVNPPPPAYLSFGIGPVNLLSANQADLESSVAGWQAASNCTVAQSSTVAWDGIYSLAVTASSAASMSATTSTGTAGIAVTAGNQYAASAHVRAGSTGRQVGVNIAWYDNSGTLLSTSTGATTADSSGAWTRIGVVATAPTNAAYAAVQIAIASPANGEVHYADGIQLAYAPDGPIAWQPGGETPLTATINDTALALERYGTRAHADTGYTQTSLAVLLHTYQTTDPTGSFSEAGLWDAPPDTNSSLSAQANPGATTLSLSGSTPAVQVGTQIYVKPAPLASPTISSFSGAATTGGFLTGGQTYYYKLTATNSLGETIPGAESTYAVPAGTNTNQVTLNWAAVTGATGYKVYRATSSGNELLLATLGNVTSYIDTSNTTPTGAPPVADSSGGLGEYATVAAAANAGATSWTLTDQLVTTHLSGAGVVAFVGNLWAHVALTGVSKTGTQLLTLQWEIAVDGV
jgi:hypothetical protein